jgi:4-amino-4-deoxy-L-arabinose transferase-like glycosyltransferase
MKNKSILVLFFELGIGAFLRFVNLLYFHALDSDEAIYTQVVFAMTKGYIPYKDIVFVHPPVYVYMEYPVMWLSPSLLALRTFNVLLGIATIFLIFYITMLIFSKKTALIASGIYALYPLAVYGNKLALIDNGLTFFLTLMMLFFLKFTKEKKLIYLFLSGMFAGISFMTKYTALLVIGALVLFSLFTFFRRKIRHLLIYIMSTLIFPLIIFFLLILTNIWPSFYIQTIQWHTIRFSMPAYEKFWFFLQILLALSPLILSAMLTAPRNISDKFWQLMMAWVFIPLATLPFSKVVFLQYGFSLIPPICILAARGLDHNIFNNFSFTKSVSKNLYLKSIWKKTVPLSDITLALIYIIMIFLFSPGFSYGIRWFLLNSVGDESTAMAIQGQMSLGNYIQNLTTPNDKIWTSDASFAFFAKRMILAPNSEYWKFQGFFQDVWGYAWTREDYRGPIPGYPEGLVTLDNIREAWEIEKPKVILFLKTSLVDQFIWDGISNPYTTQEGLAIYVRSHYYSISQSSFEDVEVWVRNDT